MLFGLLSVVYLLQTIFLVMYIIETKRFPILSLFEGIYFYAWLLITISILLHLFYKVGSCSIFLKCYWIYFHDNSYVCADQIEKSPVGEALISELLFIHITFAILSYAAFAMSFVFATLIYYFINY